MTARLSVLEPGFVQEAMVGVTRTYIYIYIYIMRMIYIYIYIYIHMHMYIHIYIYIYIHMCIHIYIYIYTYVHMYRKLPELTVPNQVPTNLYNDSVNRGKRPSLDAYLLLLRQH